MLTHAAIIEELFARYDAVKDRWITAPRFEDRKALAEYQFLLEGLIQISREGGNIDDILGPIYESGG